MKRYYLSLESHWHSGILQQNNQSIFQNGKGTTTSKLHLFIFTVSKCENNIHEITIWQVQCNNATTPPAWESGPVLTGQI